MLSVVSETPVLGTLEAHGYLDQRLVENMKQGYLGFGIAQTEVQCVVALTQGMFSGLAVVCTSGWHLVLLLVLVACNFRLQRLKPNICWLQNRVDVIRDLDLLQCGDIYYHTGQSGLKEAGCRCSRDFDSH